MSQMLADIVPPPARRAASAIAVVTEIDSVQAAKTMVLRGQAATILPVSMLAAELAAGEVAVSAITATPVRRTLALAEPSFRHLTLAAEAVRRLPGGDRRAHGGGGHVLARCDIGASAVDWVSAARASRCGTAAIPRVTQQFPCARVMLGHAWNACRTRWQRRGRADPT